MKQYIEQFETHSLVLILALLTLAGSLLYWPSLQNNFFIFDDQISIQYNETIRDITNIPLIWNAFNTRFAVGLSFALNYWLGGAQADGFRLVNVFLHIFNAFLVYCLIELLLKSTKITPRYQVFIPVTTALIFLTHPVQTEPVNFITQRFVLMASLFYLVSLIFYIKARQENKPKLWAAALGSAVLAMFSKEFTFTLPIMIVCYEFFFLNDTPALSIKRLKFLAPFLLLLFIIPCTLWRTSSANIIVTKIAQVSDAAIGGGGGRMPPQVNITIANGAQLSRKEYFLTQLNVVTTYIRLFFIPIHQSLLYDYPVARSWKEPKTLACGIFLLGIFIGGIALFKKHRIYSFFIAWFFVTLSVESSIIPIKHVISEYRLYLPLVALSSLLTLALFQFIKNLRWIVFLLIALVMTLSLMTFQRNQLWAHPVKLWENTVHQAPRQASFNLANEYLKIKEFKKAFHYLVVSLKDDPKNTRYAADASLPDLNDHRLVLETLSRYQRQNQKEKITNLGKIILFESSDQKLIDDVALALGHLGYKNLAYLLLIKSLSINDRDIVPYREAGKLCRDLGIFPQALVFFYLGHEINPQDRELRNLIIATPHL